MKREKIFFLAGLYVVHFIYMEKVKLTVHHILARSYLVYLSGFLVGVLLDKAFPLPIMDSGAETVGIIILLVSTGIILWAQTTSRRTKASRMSQTATTDHTHFHKGPYKFFRSPTHIGLALLLISYAFLTNSLPLVIVAGVVFLYTRYTFVVKEEKMLEEKYGHAYKTYKSKVKI